MHRILSVVVLALVLTPVSADDAEERAAVMAVIDTFFLDMTAKNIAGMQEIMTEDGVLQGYRETSEGRTLFSITHAEYLENLANSEGTPVERIWNPEVKIRDRIAVVWTPYDFHNDGIFSHCGINTFSMLNGEDGWSITGVVFSVRSENCETSPLGPIE